MKHNTLINALIYSVFDSTFILSQFFMAFKLQNNRITPFDFSIHSPLINPKILPTPSTPFHLFFKQLKAPLHTLDKYKPPFSVMVPLRLEEEIYFQGQAGQQEVKEEGLLAKQLEELLAACLPWSPHSLAGPMRSSASP